jgi:hypothetical protein
MSQRPTDPAKAVEYDVIKICWRDASDPPRTAEAIQAFGNYVGKIWAKIKKFKEDIKAAEKSSSKASLLHQNYDRELDTLCAAIEAANKYSEDDILRNMGGNHRLFSILTNALRQSLAKDPKATLPKAILTLMSCFRNVERAFITETLKLDRTRDKYLDQLDNASKSAFDAILSNAMVELNGKEASSKDPEVKGKTHRPSTEVKKEHVPQKAPAFTAKDLISASKKKLPPAGTAASDIRKASSSGDAKAVTISSPSKRARDDEVDLRASKKLATGTSSGAQQAGRPTPGAATSTPTQSTSTVTQPRKSVASILPGRVRPVVKPPTRKPDTPAPSSSISTISGLLAEIEKPKPAPKPKDEPVRAPETPAEKARRLRKEARRGLRVMWKPDHELTEVRLFQHDSAEDEGRAIGLVRDARDARSEGQAFKRGFREEGPDVDGEGDGEEEQDKVKEFSMRPWNDLSEVDFAVLPQEQRTETLVTRGGNVEFHTDQQKFMEDYEKRELMAIYTTTADIPESPRSPPRKATDIASAPPERATLPSTTPKLQEFHLREQQTKQFGHKTALLLASQRLGFDINQIQSAISSTSSSSHMEADRTPRYTSGTKMPLAAGNSEGFPPSFTWTQEERDATVFKLLSSGAVKHWIDPSQSDATQPKTQRRADYGDPQVQADIDNFEVVAAQLAGKPYPSADPPEHLKHMPDRVQEWQRGYNNDLITKAKADAAQRATQLGQNYHDPQAPANPSVVAPNVQNPSGVDYSAAWANYFAQQQGQTQPYAAAQPYPQQETSSQQQTPDQYAAILAQVQALQAQQAAQAQGNPAVFPPQLAATGGPDGQAQLQQILSALGGAQAGISSNDAAEYWRAWTQGAQAGPSQEHYQHNAESDRDQAFRTHTAVEANDDDTDYASGDWSNRDKGARSRKDKDSFHARGTKDYNKGINRALIGTKACLFWAKGQCAKGDQCTFRHDPNDLK